MVLTLHLFGGSFKEDGTGDNTACHFPFPLESEWQHPATRTAGWATFCTNTCAGGKLFSSSLGRWTWEGSMFPWELNTRGVGTCELSGMCPWSLLGFWRSWGCTACRYFVKFNCCAWFGHEPVYSWQEKEDLQWRTYPESSEAVNLVIMKPHRHWVTDQSQYSADLKQVCQTHLHTWGILWTKHNPRTIRGIPNELSSKFILVILSTRKRTCSIGVWH